MPYFKDIQNVVYWLDDGDDPAVWLPHCTPITEEEANALRPKPTYAELRAAEYPPMVDYIDGVVKNDQAQIDKYIADCLAVKAKYPKPEV
jgi:hypothetical protein